MSEPPIQPLEAAAESPPGQSGQGDGGIEDAVIPAVTRDNVIVDDDGVNAGPEVIEHPGEIGREVSVKKAEDLVSLVEAEEHASEHQDFVSEGLVLSKADEGGPSGAELLSQGEGIISEAKDISHRVQEILSRAQGVPSRVWELISIARDLLSKARDLLTKAGNLLSKAAHLLSKAEEIASKAQEIPKAEEQVPKPQEPVSVHPAQNNQSEGTDSDLSEGITVADQPKAEHVLFQAEHLTSKAQGHITLGQTPDNQSEGTSAQNSEDIATGNSKATITEYSEDQVTGHSEGPVTDESEVIKPHSSETTQYPVHIGPYVSLFGGWVEGDTPIEKSKGKTTEMSKDEQSDTSKGEACDKSKDELSDRFKGMTTEMSNGGASDNSKGEASDRSEGIKSKNKKRSKRKKDLTGNIVRNAMVAYGSETGTALDYADEVVRVLRRHHFNTTLYELNKVSPAWFKNYSFVIIVTSTHGDGQMPYNAREFWQDLKHGGHDITGVKFACFGIGDPKYEKFNWAAKSINQCMLQKGAETLLCFREFGTGDSQLPESTEGIFDNFREELTTEVLEKKYPLKNGQEVIRDSVPLMPDWVLDWQSTDDDFRMAQLNAPNAIVKDHIAGSIHGQACQTEMLVDEDEIPIENSFKLLVKKNTRITAASTAKIPVKDVRHFVFEKIGSLKEYGPLDVLSIMPKNFIEDVEELMQMLDGEHAYFYRDRPVIFVPTRASDYNFQTYPLPPLPKNGRSRFKWTIAKFLTHYLDFMGVPRRSFFRKISEFTNNEEHKEKLLELSHPDSVDDYHDYATRLHRSMLDVLKDFPSVRIPWNRIFDVFPPMRPRDFSIASGGKLKTDSTGTKTTFELSVDIVKYETLRMNADRKFIKKDGLCTRYLATRLPGSYIQANLKRTKWKIRPNEIADASIMLSCGTGIAPIRALMYEYEMWARTVAGGVRPVLGPNFHFPQQPRSVQGKIKYMVQGHRNRNLDYLFGDEWPTEINITLPDLFCDAAFSRLDNGKKGIYVQDKIDPEHNTNPRRIFQALVSQKGYLYICGKAGNFVKEAETSIVNDFVKCGMHFEAAKKWLEVMKREKRVRYEVW